MSNDKLKDLVKLFDNNIDLALFYVTWIKNGLNASKAYKELHPDVDDHSSRVLGSRQLAKVNKAAILEAYGLDQQLYFNQLKEALGATKWNDFTGEREPDHKTRQAYHDKLGRLLGIESDTPMINIENKILVLPNELIEKYEITSNPSDSSKG